MGLFGIFCRNICKSVILQQIPHHHFSTTQPSNALILLSRVRVVDNSALGAASRHKPPRVIHVYNKQHVAKVGDKVLLAIKGQKKKALVVGIKMPGLRNMPKFDTNNVILLEESGNPTGNRITVPIPSHLRKRKDLSKLFAIASSFV
ncbi:large ribosomal subunit protein uL14m-like [Saccoglossus kowalevskii]|uniref:Large ribosomal subunit protein uL14m n=1 Tax=Saccoglossus kowalevskii TaxID=10224 RepID=A0ABM0GQR5_SACKO|nr:PREDICTED: 39S ribosomal protein L14, mitochondrial-like [Saccoglossus kowalevskii]